MRHLSSAAGIQEALTISVTGRKVDNCSFDPCMEPDWKASARNTSWVKTPQDGSAASVAFTVYQPWKIRARYTVNSTRCTAPCITQSFSDLETRIEQEVPEDWLARQVVALHTKQKIPDAVSWVMRCPGERRVRDP
jgi:phosphatidate phosphatase APP1